MKFPLKEQSVTSPENKLKFSGFYLFISSTWQQLLYFQIQFRDMINSMNKAVYCNCDWQFMYVVSMCTFLLFRLFSIVLIVNRHDKHFIYTLYF